MAQGRKYTNLPDLDTSPDVFESQASAAVTTSQAPESTASSRTSQPDSNDESSHETSSVENGSRPPRPSRVARQKLSTSQARSQFANSRVDARGIDFSDRITGGRKSYRVPPAKRKSRRRRVEKGEGGYVDEYEVGSDSDEESLDERIARLRREVEEVKAESEERASKEDGSREGGQNHSLAELGNMLSALQTQSRTSRAATQSRTNGATTQPASGPSSGPPQPIPQRDTTPETDLPHILSTASTLESRLTLLENALGLPSLSSLSLPASQPPAPRNVLTTLQKLETQLSTLTSTTLPSLEGMTAQIETLTASAMRLKEAREAAAAAATDSGAASPTPASTRHTTNGVHTNGTTHSASASASTSTPAQSNGPPPHDLELDPHLTTRIDKLHALLPTLGALSPILPSLLDRLKSLRILHADAATVSERFGEAERLQARLGTEIERWKGALKGFEGRLQGLESREEGNKGVVEGWVRGLEEGL